MKIQDAGMILEEQPAKVAEAVKLFLQGNIFYFFFFTIVGSHSTIFCKNSVFFTQSVPEIQP